MEGREDTAVAEQVVVLLNLYKSSHIEKVRKASYNLLKLFYFSPFIHFFVKIHIFRDFGSACAGCLDFGRLGRVSWFAD